MSNKIGLLIILENEKVYGFSPLTINYLVVRMLVENKSLYIEALAILCNRMYSVNNVDDVVWDKTNIFIL